MPEQTASLALNPATGAFTIANYNWAAPLSSFLPGIAGRWGTPMWVYYVNRGQCVVSAGVRDKNGQILEFQSFNQALARVSQEGFRTFLRIDGRNWEPFRKVDDPKVEQILAIHPSEVVLTERNRRMGVEIEVAMFTLPGLPVPGLARIVRIRNLRKKAQHVEWLDGASRVLPHGLDHQQVKSVARHVEAMMGVATVRGIPIFRLKQTSADTEQVGAIEGGHFYLASGHKLGRDLVVDPEAVFAEPSAYERPWVFEDGGIEAVRGAESFRDGRTPCAFALRDETIRPGEEIEHTAVLGAVQSDEQLTRLGKKLRRSGFIHDKREENRRLIAEIGDSCFTVSGSPAFDAHCRQSFVDNVMRGGLPVSLESQEGPTTFHVYGRQNGDLERDYHFFVLEPAYLSQGTGHYRSVLQNRRNDCWFFPDSEDAALRTFVGLIQLDGYNPLEVEQQRYCVDDTNGASQWLAGWIDDADIVDELVETLRVGFTPGTLLMQLERYSEAVREGRMGVLREVLQMARPLEVGGLHEGFWVDHWHYNIDTLEAFDAVFPDRLRSVLLGRTDYTFFDNPDVILPRHQRAVHTPRGIRSWGSVYRDPDKQQLIDAREHDQHKVRTRKGPSRVYRTCLLVKLLCIVTNRLATLDPENTGMEMEAGKPGWNDSMNGLPGLFGSGSSETIELRRAVRFLLDALERIDAPAETVPVYEELATFMEKLGELLQARTGNLAGRAAFNYWDSANELKEHYREATRLGVSGREQPTTLQFIHSYLTDALGLLDTLFKGASRRKMVADNGVPFTYFVNEVTEYEETGETSHLDLPTVRPTRFRQEPVALFLEGPVHWMKDRPEEARDVYRAVRKSALFDRKLKMYKSCVNMSGENPELGRAVGAYPRGWIENESIYLHMEYKYLLEILRSGLCKEFWKDAKTALVPFMDPQVYGRSTLEGASFIVSSAYPDNRLHGRAFQPRLSGVTCELIHMWTIAVAGPRPFRLTEDDHLALALEPRLPAWLFTEAAGTHRYHDPVDGWTDVDVPADGFAFKLLGRCCVIYENPRRKDTFGTRGVRPVSYDLSFRNGKSVHVDGPVLHELVARAVRRGDVRSMRVQLG